MAGQPTPVCPTPFSHTHVFTTNNLVQDYHDVASLAVADNKTVVTPTKACCLVVADGPSNVTNRAFRSAVCRTTRASFRNPVMADADVSHYKKKTGGSLGTLLQKTFSYSAMLELKAYTNKYTLFCVTYPLTWVWGATDPALEDVIIVHLSMVSITVVPIHSDDIAVNSRDVRTV